MSNFYSKFSKGSVFKLVLGLGNLNLDQITYLIKIYSETNTDIFDFPPCETIIAQTLPILDKLSLNKPLLCLSFALKSDKHNKKAYIDINKCKKCKKCMNICPQDAIFIDCNNFFIVDKNKCIGCKKCKCSAISYSNSGIITINDASKLALKYNFDIIELHSSICDHKKIKKAFLKLNSLFPGPISVCFSREKLSEKKLLKLTKFFLEIRKDKPLIIQADGFSMSGGSSEFESTLNAVSTAQLFKDFFVYPNFFLIISGGTNENTSKLANLCNVKYNGIAVGLRARLIVDSLDFNLAVIKAKNLVNSCKNII